mmetsp:Transcript_120580/g.323727  ORF Transcript_120580/g.323727 Transcript_120580/m.323727 type:complete len:636 (+) Transcript_120580:430-2337(+)
MPHLRPAAGDVERLDVHVRALPALALHPGLHTEKLLCPLGKPGDLHQHVGARLHQVEALPVHVLHVRVPVRLRLLDLGLGLGPRLGRRGVGLRRAARRRLRNGRHQLRLGLCWPLPLGPNSLGLGHDLGDLVSLLRGRLRHLGLHRCLSLHFRFRLGLRFPLCLGLPLPPGTCQHFGHLFLGTLFSGICALSGFGPGSCQHLLQLSCRTPFSCELLILVEILMRLSIRFSLRHRLCFLLRPGILGLRFRRGLCYSLCLFLGILLQLGIGFRLSPSIGFLPEFCQRPRQPLIFVELLLCRGISFCLRLGLRFLLRPRLLRLQSGICQRLRKLLLVTLLCLSHGLSPGLHHSLSRGLRTRRGLCHGLRLCRGRLLNLCRGFCLHLGQHIFVLLLRHGFKLCHVLGLGFCLRLGLLCFRPGNCQLLRKLFLVILLCLSIGLQLCLRSGLRFLCPGPRLRRRLRERLGLVGLGLRLPSGLSFSAGVCQRLAQLRVGLLYLGIRLRLRLGIRLLHSLDNVVSLLPGICQRLRQLRFVLLCLGIRFRLHLGVRLPRGLQHGIRLLLGTCQRLGQLRRVLLLPGVRFCPRPGLRLRPCLRYSLRLRLDQLLGLVRVLRPRPGGGLLPGIRQRLRQPLFVLPP